MKIVILILTLIALAILISLSPEGAEKSNVLWASGFILAGMAAGAFLWGRCRALAVQTYAANERLRNQCEELEKQAEGSS